MRSEARQDNTLGQFDAAVTSRAPEVDDETYLGCPIFPRLEEQGYLARDCVGPSFRDLQSVKVRTSDATFLRVLDVLRGLPGIEEVGEHDAAFSQNTKEGCGCNHQLHSSVSADQGYALEKHVTHFTVQPLSSD